MVTANKIPFYARTVILLIGLYLLVSMLSAVQDILLPILYSILIAILLSPLVNYLVNKRVNHILAIAIVLITVILFFCGLIALISVQLSRFIEIIPQINSKIQGLINELSNWVSDYFHVSEQKVEDVITETKTEFTPKQSDAIGVTLSKTGHILASLFLTPVYIFMILYYRRHLIQFIHKLFSHNNGEVDEVLTETKSIIKSYLVGLFTEIAIMAVLNSLGLLLLGIDYAILLGVLGALLNVVPYLGNIIAMGIYMIVALVTKTPVYVLYVFGMYTVLQFIDNNYIVPHIVGSKVKLNALVSLIAVLCGAALWGIPGMFLSIPLTAIIKLILDRIDGGKPWGFLLGEYAIVQKKRNKKPKPNK